MKETLKRIIKKVWWIVKIIFTTIVTKFSTMDNEDRFFALVLTNGVVIIGGLIVKLMFLLSPFVGIFFIIMMVISLFIMCYFWLKDEMDEKCD